MKIWSRLLGRWSEGDEGGPVADGVAQDIHLALWALRVELLATGTLYGLSAEVESPHPNDSRSWSAWMGWLDLVGARLDRALADVGAQYPESRILQTDDLTAAFDVLRRASVIPVSERSEFDWKGRLESLEAAARGVERLGGTPMAENRADRAGLDLLGVLEDSLILKAYGMQAEPELGASGMEMYRLLTAAREDMAWGFLDGSPEPLPISLAPTEPDEREVEGLILDFLRQMNDTTTYYYSVDPKRNPLADEQIAEVKRHLTRGATTMRALAYVPPAFELPAPRGQRMTLRSLLARLRKVHRSLVLAISDIPERRAQAVSLEELKSGVGDVRDVE